MSTEERIPNFINGIGVLNYTIQTKSIGISEFYLPQVPNVSTYIGEDPYEAFGWLFGGNNIDFMIHTIDGYLDKFRKNQVGGLTCKIFETSPKYKFSGYCFSNLENDLLSADYYNTCSGYVQGYVQGQSDSFENVQCVGNLRGVITNLKNSQVISLSGTLTGFINLTTAPVSGTYYQLTNVSGNLLNITYGEDKNNKHIINLQQTHILGRQLLSDNNPMMGKQLNLVPSSLAYEYIIQPTNWAIDEFSAVSVKKFTQIQLPTEQNTIKLRLAMPKYMKKLVQYNVNTEQSNEDNTVNIQTPKNYYAFIYNLGGEIVTNINDTIGNKQQVKSIIGPLNSLDQVINILNQYAIINNVKIEKVSETLFNFIML